MVSLKMSILQIWVNWASKITLKNLQLSSIKIKGGHAPCDVTCSRSILLSQNMLNHLKLISRPGNDYFGSHPSEWEEGSGNQTKSAWPICKPCSQAFTNQAWNEVNRHTPSLVPRCSPPESEYVYACNFNVRVPERRSLGTRLPHFQMCKVKRGVVQTLLQKKPLECPAI